MKIFAVNRRYAEAIMWKPQKLLGEGNFISIFSRGSFSPFPERQNVLKLQFDDVTDSCQETDFNGAIFFNENHAEEIKKFIEKIDTKKDLYVHCDAGISRSGAVGTVLNEYFNRFLQDDKLDYEVFKWFNPQILPNPLVTRILRAVLFGYQDNKSWFCSTEKQSPI